MELRKPEVRAAILSQADDTDDPMMKRQLGYIRTVLPDCHVIHGTPDYEQPRAASIGALAEAQGVSLEEVAYDGMVSTDEVVTRLLHQPHGVRMGTREGPSRGFAVDSQEG